MYLCGRFYKIYYVFIINHIFIRGAEQFVHVLNFGSCITINSVVVCNDARRARQEVGEDFAGL